MPLPLRSCTGIADTLRNRAGVHVAIVDAPSLLGDFEIALRILRYPFWTGQDRNSTTRANLPREGLHVRVGLFVVVAKLGEHVHRGNEICVVVQNTSQAADVSD